MSYVSACPSWGRILPHTPDAGVANTGNGRPSAPSPAFQGSRGNPPVPYTRTPVLRPYTSPLGLFPLYSAQDNTIHLRPSSESPGDTMIPVVSSPSMSRVVGSKLWRAAAPAQRRGFASTTRRLDTYGFIGLGQMVSHTSPTPSQHPAQHTSFISRDSSSRQATRRNELTRDAGPPNGEEPAQEAAPVRHGPRVRREPRVDGGLRRGREGRGVGGRGGRDEPERARGGAGRCKCPQPFHPPPSTQAADLHSRRSQAITSSTLLC